MSTLELLEESAFRVYCFAGAFWMIVFVFVILQQRQPADAPLPKACDECEKRKRLAQLKDLEQKEHKNG